MNQLCRFCLIVSNKEMCKLQESGILEKIEKSLKVLISTEELLPQQICKECAEKIDQIHTFCSNIRENEQKLLQYYSHGSLQNNCLNIANNILIKQESVLFNNILTNEDDNAITKIQINLHKKGDVDNGQLNVIKENIKESEADIIKNEIFTEDYNETALSTDDETLSTISKDKENHIVNNVTEKTLCKTKPQMRRKRKRNGNVTPIHVNTATIKFSCLMCLEVFETQLELIKHYHDEHLNKNNSEPKLKYNISEIDGNATYKCEICKKCCSTKKEIVKHVALHNEERPLICKLCGRMYKTVTEIIRHARVHNGFKLHCSYKCGYTTAYQGALKEHENRHLDVYKYRCDKCGKGFHVKTWYEQHQNIHNGVKPFVCQICGLAFHMARYLTAHRSLIHPQSSSVKRYICVHCNQKCDSANSLSLHLEVHGINKDKEFLCDFCGKILSSADQLKYHHRMHSGEKPYSCSICNKSFAKKFNVKVHMSSHSGEKTHACTRCGKRYTQRSTLLRHQKRHHSGSNSTRTEK